MDYTKGEWKVYKFDDIQRIDVVAEDKMNFYNGIVANIVGEKSLSYDERKVNAHLISAAPDMYEALKLLKDPQNQVEVTPLGYAIFRLSKEKVEQIARAIEKAEGK